MQRLIALGTLDRLVVVRHLEQTVDTLLVHPSKSQEGKGDRESLVVELLAQEAGGGRERIKLRYHSVVWFRFFGLWYVQQPHPLKDFGYLLLNWLLLQGSIAPENGYEGSRVGPEKALNRWLRSQAKDDSIGKPVVVKETVAEDVYVKVDVPISWQHVQRLDLGCRDDLLEPPKGSPSTEGIDWNIVFRRLKGKMLPSLIRTRFEKGHMYRLGVGLG